MEESTLSFINRCSELGCLQMVGGAVFALQQDTLKAYAVDMREAESMLIIAALDRAKSHQLGEYPERHEQVMRALHSIDEINLDFIEGEKPKNSSEKEHSFNLLGARMRSEASRIWSLTMMSKIEQFSVLQIRAVVMWSALQSVAAIDLAEDANLFTGTYFNGISGSPFNFDHWPRTIEHIGFRL